MFDSVVDEVTDWRLTEWLPEYSIESLIEWMTQCSTELFMEWFTGIQESL